MKPSESDARNCPYFGRNSTVEHVSIAEVRRHADAADGCAYCLLLREIADRLSGYVDINFNAEHLRRFGWRRVPISSTGSSFSTDLEVFVTKAQARLVETTPDQCDRYIALSHCWGNSRPACLTKKSTISKNMSGITDALMPHTFRDAIKVTQMLEVPYLWIDSICIVQDDPEEWQKESAKMTAYYENSYITICATAANSDDDGLWQHVEGVPSAEKLATMFTGMRYEVCVRIDEGNDSIDATHISWGRKTVAWRIAKDIAPLYMSDAGSLKNQARAMQKAATLKNVSNIWRLLVDHYSELSLTNPTDRLPAISGLAKACKSIRPADDRYLAGLWMTTLITDLCWNVPFHIIPQARPKLWVAPTWSWASLCEHVSYASCMYTNANEINHTEVLHATTEAAGHDPTGRISSGSITLFGPIQSATVGQIHLNKVRVEAHSLSIGCCFDSVVDLADGLVQGGSIVHCLRMHSIPSWDWIMVLVAEIGMPGTYRRVGMAQHDTHEINRHWYHDKPKIKVRII
ncbi:hypothetical protein OPT61_g6419 [Boeremia exigua]|uniref:Uncharacterized protein n=1 Tax=Boeremia exigua TaxID=749465 RepID=A0ACC2I6P9_9PLEO|nr:hypothetical protein OPT61_g6419 [Boeremia exigua]